MSTAAESSALLLRKSLAHGRIHSGYLVHGGGDAPLEATLEFARGIVCLGARQGPRPCEQCRACSLSGAKTKTVALDAKGEKGPLYRHVGGHSDLYWLERGAESTRVTVGQVRELQTVLRRSPTEGEHRVGIVAEAEWLSHDAQGALLHVLEEPPRNATILLVAKRATSLLSTIRSRCIKVPFPAEATRELRGPDATEDVQRIVSRLDAIHTLGMVELLDWAEEYRGVRRTMVDKVDELLGVSCDWLHERICQAAAQGNGSAGDELDAYRALTRYRRELTRRNLNTMMTVEKSLFTLRGAVRA